MRRLIGGAAAALATAGLGAAVLGPGRAAADCPGQIVPYEDARAVALGARLYDAHCASCHGSQLEGQVADWRVPGADGLLPAPPHDATGHTWHHPDRLLVDIVTRGTEAVVGGGYRSAMIGFGDVLSPAEVRAVLAFIKSRWPPEIVAIHDEVNARAAASDTASGE